MHAAMQFPWDSHLSDLATSEALVTSSLEGLRAVTSLTEGAVTSLAEGAVTPHSTTSTSTSTSGPSANGTAGGIAVTAGGIAVTPAVTQSQAAAGAESLHSVMYGAAVYCRFGEYWDAYETAVRLLVYRQAVHLRELHLEAPARSLCRGVVSR